MLHRQFLLNYVPKLQKVFITGKMFRRNLQFGAAENPFASPVKAKSPDGVPEKARHYPNATSSTIISAKPRAKPMVPRLECRPWEASGISSSTTT